MERYYQNSFDPFVPNAKFRSLDLANACLSEEAKETVKKASAGYLSLLEEKFYKLDYKDYSIYTGSCGLALVYLKLFKITNERDFIRKGLTVVSPILPHLNKRRISFLNGDAGPLALGAVLNYYKGDVQQSLDCIERLKRLMPIVLHEDTCNEILYGRAGYLYSLLFVNYHYEDDIIEKDIFRKVIHAIVQAGQNLSQRIHSYCPLMYEWHGKNYIGAAHGIAGIYYVLLLARKFLKDEELFILIKPSIDFLLTLKFPSGNYPSSLSNETDRLVQWCHGSPGIVSLLCLATQVFKSDLYKNEALICAENIWQKGIVKKGYSICHGVAGNAYAFLNLYQLTQDIVHLYRAYKFAEWCCFYGKYQEHQPDRPYSLYEGLAGPTYLLIDIEKPESAKFPGYEL